MPAAKTQIKVQCADCSTVHLLMVNTEGFLQWFDGGELIQNALPDLSPDERELLISQTCSDCFNNLFNLPE